MYVRLRLIDGEVQAEDNGCGVLPDIAERLFEPFETRGRVVSGSGCRLVVK